jgi:hypothetical protein
MFWGDIAVKYPELLSILPKDVIAVAWGYGAQPNFDSSLKPYKDARLDLFVSPGASNWNMLNTTWDDDGEALFSMTWPAVVFGAACAWQPDESSIERFKADYDWVFYGAEGRVFRDAIQSLSRSHSILHAASLGDANDELFWADPFSEPGSRLVQKAEAPARDLRLEAERALVALYRHRGEAMLNPDTLDYLIFAGLRLDALGLKLQLSAEMSRYYWEAYLNMSNRTLVMRNLNEISGANGRLQDLRDSTTRLRDMYSKLWLAENRAYWLGNVTVRYDHLAEQIQTKIQAMQQAVQQYREQGTLPPPQQMGFYSK